MGRNWEVSQTKGARPSPTSPPPSSRLRPHPLHRADSLPRPLRAPLRSPLPGENIHLGSAAFVSKTKNRKSRSMQEGSLFIGQNGRGTRVPFAQAEGGGMSRRHRRARPNTGLLDGEKLAVLAPNGSNAQDHASILTLYYPIPSRSLLQDAKVPGPGAYEPVQDERGDNAEARAGLTLTLTLTLSLTLTLTLTLTHGQMSSMRGEGATTGGYAFKSRTIQRPKSKVCGSTPAKLGPGSYTPTQTRLGENASVADMRGEEGAPAQSRALSWRPCHGRPSTRSSAAWDTKSAASTAHGVARRRLRFLQQLGAARRETLCGSTNGDRHGRRRRRRPPGYVLA